eukprot:s4048_g3.t1
MSDPKWWLQKKNRGMFSSFNQKLINRNDPFIHCDAVAIAFILHSSSIYRRPLLSTWLVFAMSLGETDGGAIYGIDSDMTIPRVSACQKTVATIFNHHGISWPWQTATRAG